MILFVFMHILIGLALIYFKGKLPTTLTTCSLVFLTMCFIYWGADLVNSFKLMGARAQLVLEIRIVEELVKLLHRILERF